MEVLISRTDSIGDVVLTLPLCGWIKQNIPKSEVYFLCNCLTKEVISTSKFVDKVIVWEGHIPSADVVIHAFPNRAVARAAKKKGIDLRIGTTHRLFHLTTCNRLVTFSRRKSNLHESQLNFKLLKGLGYSVLPALRTMPALIGWKSGGQLSANCLPDKFNLIFHIKSKGSAKEWQSGRYLELAKQLKTGVFNIILTGTETEGDIVRKEIPEIFRLEHVKDTFGQLSLTELINLIGQIDGLLACSTGPLHIAGASQVNCIGLYPKTRPIHAGRWRPVGLKSRVIEEENEVAAGKGLNIRVETVYREIMKWV